MAFKDTLSDFWWSFKEKLTTPQGIGLAVAAILGLAAVLIIIFVAPQDPPTAQDLASQPSSTLDPTAPTSTEDPGAAPSNVPTPGTTSYPEGSVVNCQDLEKSAKGYMSSAPSAAQLSPIDLANLRQTMYNLGKSCPTEANNLYKRYASFTGE